MEQQVKPEENPRLLKILSWKENSSNGNGFGHETIHDEPDILEEPIDEPLAGVEPIPSMASMESSFMNTQALDYT